MHGNYLSILKKWFQLAGTNANFSDGSVFDRSISWAEGSMDSDKYKDEDGNWVYPYDNGELIDITGLNGVI